MFSRSLRIIILSSVVVLFVLNLVYFTIVNNSELSNNWTVIHVFDHENISHYNYKGFAYFFEYISTFPGLGNCQNAINLGLTMLSGSSDISGYNVVDAILGVLYLLATPVTILVTFVLDIINNFIWVIGFFIPYFSQNA